MWLLSKKFQGIRYGITFVEVQGNRGNIIILR